MRTATFEQGDVVVNIPGEYLSQQTCSTSEFDRVPAECVDLEALVEANRTNGVTWYKVGDRLHISVPTKLIKWEGEK